MRLLLIISCVLFVASATAFAGNGCPNVKEIKRTSGEFSWYSLVPGWTGHFAYPMQGKGHSTEVKNFIEARWIQLTNLKDSQGYFECDYQGNYDDEVIRFMQAGTRANLKPTDNHWYCQLNPNFPGTQCTCSMSTQLCILEAVPTSVDNPVYVNPDVTSIGGSPAEVDTFLSTHQGSGTGSGANMNTTQDK